MSQYIKRFGLAAIVATGLALGTFGTAPGTAAARELSTTPACSGDPYVRLAAPYTRVAVCFPYPGEAW